MVLEATEVKTWSWATETVHIRLTLRYVGFLRRLRHAFLFAFGRRRPIVEFHYDVERTPHPGVLDDMVDSAEYAYAHGGRKR